MIDNEFLLRQLPHQLDRRRQLARIDQNVIRKLKCFKRHAAHKIRSHEKTIIRLRLRNVPNSPKLLKSRKMFESPFNIRRSQIHPAHNPRDPPISFRQPQQKLRLRFRLIRLHRDRRIHSVRVELRLQDPQAKNPAESPTFLP